MFVGHLCTGSSFVKHRIFSPNFLIRSVFLLLRCRSTLYILKHVLCQIYELQVFSQFMACLFIFLMVSRDEYKFLILTKSNLIKSIFSCMVLPVCWIRNVYLHSRSQRYSPMFSSQHFIVLAFMLRYFLWMVQYVGQRSFYSN